MAQTSLTGPSRNACSSALSVGALISCSLFQSGLPLNSSASHQTVPASSASFSVCDIAGSTFLNIASAFLLSIACRIGATPKTRTAVMYSTQPTVPAVPIIDSSSMVTVKAPIAVMSEVLWYRHSASTAAKPSIESEISIFVFLIAAVCFNAPLF